MLVCLSMCVIKFGEVILAINFLCQGVPQLGMCCVHQHNLIWGSASPKGAELALIYTVNSPYSTHAKNRGECETSISP